MAQNPDMPGGQEITLVNENIEISPNGQNRRGRSVPPLMEDDNSLRTWAPQVVRYVTTDPAGNTVVKEVIALAETNGRPTTVVYGQDSSGNQDPLRTNADQQQQVQLVGVDEGSNNDGLRTDPNRILWNRPFTQWQDVNPVEIPATEGDLWAPGGASAEVYEIEFLVVNNDAGSAAVTVSVGLDLAAGGGLAAPEYWVFNEVVPYPGSLGWRGPFIMRGDDAVRGIASAANDASIHFRIKRVDNGA